MEVMAAGERVEEWGLPFSLPGIVGCIAGFLDVEDAVG